MVRSVWSRPLPWILTVVGAFLASPALAEETAGRSPYDPLQVPTAALPAPIDLDVVDSGRQRTIPIRVYLPAAGPASPVVLFSHGLGGARTNNAYLGKHWAGRGYVAVFLQHPGSDETVWQDAPRLQRMARMREAASMANFMHRVQDVPKVLDHLDTWTKQPDHPLARRLDLGRLGMSGHSFGAITTQAVSGQTFPVVGQRYTDPRIKAAVAFSPSSPRAGDRAASFGGVTIPWLLMTGTHDLSIIGDADLKSRLDVYRHLKAPAKYELVLDKAEHSAFSERALPGDKETRNPNHHRVILALSTAFWDGYLRGDAAALAWLQGPGPRTVLQPADNWQQEVK